MAKKKVKLTRAFYERDDPALIAKDLLGKTLCARHRGALASGIIVETEAYNGRSDKACHAFGYRLTPRTRVMFERGGTAYVYLCYGVHYLFNVITNRAGEPDAVLIRALEPIEGIPLMLRRRGMKEPKRSLTAGPGALAQALGIRACHNGIDLTGDRIWIEDRGMRMCPEEIMESPRIGVHYAGADAALPWRFRVRHSTWTSLAR